MRGDQPTAELFGEGMPATLGLTRGASALFRLRRTDPGAQATVRF